MDDDANPTVAALRKARGMLVVLLATCHQTLVALEAAGNVLDTDMADDLRRMIDRTEAELDVIVVKLAAMESAGSKAG